ncbi:hypothetical protein Landi51_09652 [Colletotrichum acutatum]
MVARVEQDYEEESSGSCLKVDYPIGESLEAQFLKRPEIDNGVAASIRVGIKGLSFYLLRRMTLDRKHNYANFVNGLVDGVRALEDALNKMGIYVDSKQQVAPNWPKPLGEPEHSFGQREDEMGLFLDHKAMKTLVDSCPVHPVHPVQRRWDIFESNTWQDFEDISLRNCPCMVVRKLMYGFATTALALMLCNFDAAEVRVQDAVISGYSEIALSKRITCVMENESFDDCGRTLRVQSGRTSLAGAFRNIVVEETFLVPDGALYDVLQGINETADVVSLAGRNTLEPSLRPPDTKITMDAFV